jgi:ferric-dicitrate binding protein FerR (iron transport regulator)
MEETNYLKGLSPEGLKALEELKELQEWRNASPENENEYLKMQETWLSSIEPDEYHSDKEEDFQHLLARINEDKRRHILRSPRRIVWQAAAAIALLIATSYFSIQIAKPSETIASVDTHIEVLYGSQVKTILPDGTTVWLNADSRLTYSQEPGSNKRKAYLIGEGYFEVVHDENMPFIVQAGDLQINVLGTKFNVRNRLDDREATVSLLEGSVSIASSITPSEIITIEPNQKVFFNRESGNVHLTDVIASFTIDWTRGYLFYDDVLLADIARDLERSYNVNITVHPDVAGLRFFGRFSRVEKSIDEIMTILATAGGITYEVTDREITIR